MSTTMPQSAPMTAEDYEATFDQLMAEAESINGRMGHNRTRIEQLEAETKATIEDIVRLKVETRTLLASMGEKV